MVGGFLGVGLAAFVGRCLRWRVRVRWYLVALFGVPVATTLFAVAIYGAEGFASPSVLLSVLTLLALQLILLQAAEEIGWTAASSRIGCETGTAH